MIANRKLWVDYAKFFGIVLVVLGHTLNSTKNPQIFAWIYSFHMPLFFILAGYFVKVDQSVREIFKKSIKSLIIPYVFFYFIAYFAMMILLYFKDSYTYAIEQSVIFPLIGFFLGEGIDTSFSIFVNTPLWFLLALFFCRVFFQIAITKFSNVRISLILLNVISILLLVSLRYFDFNIYLSIDSAILSIPFYTFGYLFRQYDEKQKYSFWKNMLQMSFFTILSVLLYKINIRDGRAVDMCNMYYGQNIFLFYIIGVIGSMGIIYFSKLFSNKEYTPLLYLGKNTIIILGTHNVIIRYMSQLLDIAKFRFDWMSHGIAFIDSSILAILTALLSVIPIYLINNYFPFIIGKFKQSK